VEWFAESIHLPGGLTTHLRLAQMELMTAESGSVIFIRISGSYRGGQLTGCHGPSLKRPNAHSLSLGIAVLLHFPLLPMDNFHSLVLVENQAQE